MATKIAFANFKGGVGKTVSATSVASILDSKGYKTLLIDCDPQRNASSVYSCKVDGVPTLYDVIASGYTIRQCIQKTSFGEICPSDDGLYGIDSQIRAHPGIYRYIKKALSEVEAEYDFIVFDTPPVFGLVVGNVLMCCDYVIVPLECELFGVQGLLDFNNMISEFQEDNPNLKILGLLRVKHKKKQKLTRDVEENVLPKYASQIGTKIFKSTIRESVKLKESIMLRMRLSDHARGSTVESDYRAFVDELLMEVKTRGCK